MLSAMASKQIEVQMKDVTDNPDRILNISVLFSVKLRIRESYFLNGNSIEIELHDSSQFFQTRFFFAERM